MSGHYNVPIAGATPRGPPPAPYHEEPAYQPAYDTYSSGAYSTGANYDTGANYNTQEAYQAASGHSQSELPELDTRHSGVKTPYQFEYNPELWRAGPAAMNPPLYPGGPYYEAPTTRAARQAPGSIQDHADVYYGGYAAYPPMMLAAPPPMMWGVPPPHAEYYEDYEEQAPRRRSRTPTRRSLGSRGKDGKPAWNPFFSKGSD